MLSTLQSIAYILITVMTWKTRQYDYTITHLLFFSHFALQPEFMISAPSLYYLYFNTHIRSNVKHHTEQFMSACCSSFSESSSLTKVYVNYSTLLFIVIWSHLRVMREAYNFQSYLLINVYCSFLWMKHWMTTLTITILITTSIICLGINL